MKSKLAQKKYAAEKYNSNLPENSKKALGCYMAIGNKTVEREAGEVGTSIFDPVLCELIYKWFCPSKGKILDPFAGGSVRGIVAEYLGYSYTGIELRQEQVEENYNQAKIIGLKPNWVVGDSVNVKSLVKDKVKRQ